jgi:hypothetical protein
MGHNATLPKGILKWWVHTGEYCHVLVIEEVPKMWFTKLSLEEIRNGTFYYLVF